MPGMPCCTCLLHCSQQTGYAEIKRRNDREKLAFNFTLAAVAGVAAFSLARAARAAVLGA